MITPRYTSSTLTYKFVVIASYQKPYMDSPDDTRISHHKYDTDANKAVELHKLQGATRIEKLILTDRFEVKYR